jgi:hypothetical protein
MRCCRYFIKRDLLKLPLLARCNLAVLNSLWPIKPLRQSKLVYWPVVHQLGWLATKVLVRRLPPAGAKIHQNAGTLNDAISPSI